MFESTIVTIVEGGTGGEGTGIWGAESGIERRNRGWRGGGEGAG